MTFPFISSETQHLLHQKDLDLKQKIRYLFLDCFKKNIMFLVYEKLETQYLIQHHIQLLWGLQ